MIKQILKVHHGEGRTERHVKWVQFTDTPGPKHTCAWWLDIGDLPVDDGMLVEVSLLGDWRTDEPCDCCGMFIHGKIHKIYGHDQTD